MVGRRSAAIFIRRALRALCCIEIFLRGLPVLFRLRASGGSNWRAPWAQWISREFLRLINCKVRVSGAIPRHGLIVCNHLSYLDILAILSVCQAAFVSKNEVRRWPFFGLLATMAGTIFVDRGRRTAVFMPLESVVCALKAGHPVVLFPDGTSSDGSEVLPFRSSLLEAAIVSRAPITPTAIDYDLKEGSIVDEICYWRDMAFGTHFWNLLGKESVTASLRFGLSHAPTQGRKEHARALRLAVIQLRNNNEEFTNASLTSEQIG
jgi:lyso-ornithine lipid O-acyltransferase